MKRICVFMGLIALLSACSKKSNDQPNSVTINGTAYPTVTIGGQIWTSVNYSGPGGYHSADNNQYGDYYTQTQALAITLPAGWRVPSLNDYSALLGNFTQKKDAFNYFTLDEDHIGILLSTSGGWLTTATNTSGFNAEPNGLYDFIGQTANYQNGGNHAAAFFMTSDYENLTGRMGLSITLPDGAVVGGASIYSPYGQSTFAYSLRFVKDK